MHLVQPAPEPAKPARLKPGERRAQILRVLAAMLEDPRGERVTTAALAARLQLSEAALYRHFASKAQMLEALIQQAEEQLLAQAEQIAGLAQPAEERAQRLMLALLRFGEAQPGLARVLVGDALVGEHERLAQRVEQLFQRLEATQRHWLREGDLDSAQPGADAQGRAAVLMGFAQGRLLRFVRSGFKRAPTENLEQWRRWLPG
ncbi:MAG: nucleoid occlusion factor SlmA [Inhella sp.]